MNPTALRLRGVEVHDTRAAVVRTGFKRRFFGKRGMASLVRDASPNAGPVHSVAHLLDAEGVAILDAIEVGYDKVILRAELLPRFGSARGGGGGEELSEVEVFRCVNCVVLPRWPCRRGGRGGKRGEEGERGGERERGG